MLKCSLAFVVICFTLRVSAHDWQQRVEYQMEVDLNVHTHRFSGSQQLVYFNNSPDTITELFYHLYFNAFQPGSAMDIWNRHARDPDMRIEQIEHLQPEEQGFLNVKSLTQNGRSLSFDENGTILYVALAEPLHPGKTASLEMEFTGQVPIQIRRSGRDNAEGISYSMSQWYPKLCVYDADGWHPDQYLGREFYGDFGDFDVKISIDKRFIVAATGYLQNGNSIGYGYQDMGVVVPELSTEKLIWHFHATNVHDFVWAADPEYTHTHYTREDGIVFHYFYQNNTQTEESWTQLPAIMDHAFDFLNEHFGRYPYQSFSFIQGGDQGMEYPMATLITGNRSLLSLVGVSIHELAHSWYYGVIGTDELRYAWMDEGFVNYATVLTMKELYNAGLLKGEHTERNFESDYKNYSAIVRLGIEEPMSTHANHFSSNTAYFGATYAKGCVFLAQLEYIIGTKAIRNTLLHYFNAWKFKHPRPEDFIRIAEEESGLVLNWYLDYWISSTKTIDYGIENVYADGVTSIVTLRRTGEISMPLELRARTKRGTDFLLYIPLDQAQGNKQFEMQDCAILEAWKTPNLVYSFDLPVKFSQLASIEIDPSGRMADINRADNSFLIYAEED